MHAEKLPALVKKGKWKHAGRDDRPTQSCLDSRAVVTGATFFPGNDASAQ
jgi:hypothetical protein